MSVLSDLVLLSGSIQHLTLFLLFVLHCRGDHILAVNGKEVRTVRDVLVSIGLEVGKELHLTVWREDHELAVTLVTAPERSRR